jgi:hypothetical protein
MTCDGVHFVGLAYLLGFRTEDVTKYAGGARWRKNGERLR